MFGENFDGEKIFDLAGLGGGAGIVDEASHDDAAGLVLEPEFADGIFAAG